MLKFIVFWFLFAFNLFCQEHSYFFSGMHSGNSLNEGMSPESYRARKEPVLNLALLYYGQSYDQKYIENIAFKFEKLVERTTKKLLKVNVIMTKVLPFRHQISDYPDYVQAEISDKSRLQRLWYYDYIGANVVEEAYTEFKKSLNLSEVSTLKKLDVLLVVSGAQYNALGYASGRVGIIENPMEIAWGLPGGGRVEFRRDNQVLDELLHEFGHTIFFGHASAQCFKKGMSVKQSKACCEKSPSKNDIMSYCRKRGSSKNTFSACNLSNIKNGVLPAMKQGKKWNFPERISCK